jgi:predicted O-methyltransferase YrrM
VSKTSTPVSEALFRYLAERTPPEDALLRDLKREAAAAGLPAIWIAPEQGWFMQILLRLAGAHDVVEVGTLAGYSAIVMARALPAGGRVRTIEVDAKHAGFAGRWIAKSDVAERIELIQADAASVLPRLADDSADAVFLDADRTRYAAYLPHVLRILRRGGLLMVDNAFLNGDVLTPGPHPPGAAAMIAFNDQLARTPELAAVIVPLGDGLWVGVRR